MPTIDRPDGARVAYDVVGEGDGPPVILGHSLFCDRSMWSGVIDGLAAKHRFINVELRGHGASTAPAAFTLDDLVDDWLAILEREGIERAVVCGLSTGGFTAIRLAMRAPDRSSGVVLCSTRASGEPALRRLRFHALGFLYVRLGILPRGALLSAMFAPATVRDRPDLVESFLRLVQTFDRRQLGRAMSAVFGRPGSDPAAIGVPALVVAGEDDLNYPPAAMRRLAEAIRGARFEVIAGAGHLTAIEQPERVAAVLGDFLASLPS